MEEICVEFDRDRLEGTQLDYEHGKDGVRLFRDKVRKSIAGRGVEFTAEPIANDVEQFCVKGDDIDQIWNVLTDLNDEIQLHPIESDVLDTLINKVDSLSDYDSRGDEMPWDY